MGDRKEPSPPPGEPGYMGPTQYKPYPPPAPPRPRDAIESILARFSAAPAAGSEDGAVRWVRHDDVMDLVAALQRLMNATQPIVAKIAEWREPLTSERAAAFGTDVALAVYEETRRECADELERAISGPLRRKGQFYGRPLEVYVRDGELAVRIGVNALAHAIAYSDWANPFNEQRNDYIREFAIEDAEQFAKDVVHAMLHEREDGSTPLSDFLDAMSKASVEDGSLGLHEDDQSIPHGQHAPCETWAVVGSGEIPEPDSIGKEKDRDGRR